MKTAFLVIAIVFGLIFWKIHNDKQKAADSIAAVAQAKEDKLKAYVQRITRERDANKVKELNEDKPLGEAGMAVRTFFRHWKDGQYTEMHNMLASPAPDAANFPIRLQKATLNWRHLEIIGEKPEDTGWLVAFRIEVTSPESALAAVAIDEMAAYKNLKGEYSDMSLQPLILGIEKFTRYNLEWRVDKIDDKMRIEAYPGQNRKGINLLSYVMNDTIPLMRRLGVFQGAGAMPNIQDQIQSAMAFWLTIDSLELKMEKDGSDKIIKAAGPLIGQGRENLTLITEGVLAAQQQGRRINLR